MAIPGWTRNESPFHSGELAIQERMGIQEQMDKQGRRMIREYLPEQFREFFTQLPYVIVGSVDKFGNPWASILVGKSGFIFSPDEFGLRIDAHPLEGDPLVNNLAEGIDIGILGIELPTRRRNRVNGVINEIDTEGFEVKVRQSFGNCPKFIQARNLEPQQVTRNKSISVSQIDLLGEVEQAIITSADTFFIATAYQDQSAGIASGIDVSHRGGKPGFVRVDDEGTLSVPDFSGNCHFNTFGNLEVNPKAGLLFVDFEKGDLLYLTGKAEVIWQGEEISQYEGAQRLMRFSLNQGIRTEASLPLRWSTPEFSPFLQNTGSWG